MHLCTNRAYMPLLSIILCFFFSLFSPLPCHTLGFFFRFEESTDLIEKERGRKRKKIFRNEKEEEERKNSKRKRRRRRRRKKVDAKEERSKQKGGEKERERVCF